MQTFNCAWLFAAWQARERYQLIGEQLQAKAGALAAVEEEQDGEVEDRAAEEVQSLWTPPRDVATWEDQFEFGEDE